MADPQNVRLFKRSDLAIFFVITDSAYVQFRMSWKVHTFVEDMMLNMKSLWRPQPAGLDSFLLKL